MGLGGWVSFHGVHLLSLPSCSLCSTAYRLPNNWIALATDHAVRRTTKSFLRVAPSSENSGLASMKGRSNGYRRRARPGLLLPRRCVHRSVGTPVSPPQAVLVAGANGAGKTTFARQVLALLHPGVPFLNVDEIQLEGPPFSESIAASKEFLRRLRDVELAKQEFALETTLAFRTYIPSVDGHLSDITSFCTSLRFPRRSSPWPGWLPA